MTNLMFTVEVLLFILSHTEKEKYAKVYPKFTVVECTSA